MVAGGGAYGKYDVYVCGWSWGVWCASQIIICDGVERTPARAIIPMVTRGKNIRNRRSIKM